MFNRIPFLLVFFSVLLGLLLCGSCKKRSAPQKTESFDGAVDGVVVRPLPPMDIVFAQRVVKEGPVSATADTTLPEDAAGAVSLSVPASSGEEELSPGAVRESTESPAASEAEPTEYDYDDYSDNEDDPNSF